VGVSWWATSAAPDPTAYLKVTYQDTSACGELRSADGGQVRLTVTGSHDPVTIPLAQITHLTVVAGCG